MSDFSAVVNRLRAHSHFAQRLIEADPQRIAALAEGAGKPFARAEMERIIQSVAKNNLTELKIAMRKLRQQVWLRVAARDLIGMANLTEVMTTMTDLAEVTSLAAQSQAQFDLVDRFGTPIGGESGTPQELIVVAMGKLGGTELNVSSDVDLIFVYPEEGETNGAHRISNHEFFSKLGKQIVGILSEVTPDGFVFRVDMRLRPYGESGALTISFAALETYFITQGRPWERYAWIKARPITGSRHSELAALVKPFVYRRYLDFAAVAQLRDLHSQIRAEVQRLDRIDNIKLGPGGIREIEFLAQVFQLIRGGRDVGLQGRSTISTLSYLAQLKLVSEDSAQALIASYVFLRNLEHRLQYLDDAQTHSLPSDQDQQLRIAQSLNLDDYQSVLALLEQHRNCVTRQFDAIFSHKTVDDDGTLAAVWRDSLDKIESIKILETLGFDNGATVSERLAVIRRSARYQQLPESSRARFDALVPALMDMAAGMPRAETTLFRTLDLFESVSRRETYLALLLENRSALKKVAELASASGWAMNYLAQHPILLDELLDHRELGAAPQWPDLKRKLQLDILQYDGDVERQWDLLRHFKQTQMFGLIAQDVAGQLALEKLSDHLSDLADCLLDTAINAVWRSLKTKHCDVLQFCIVAYGKLGGKELGYGSDLDIIFLFKDAHPDAAENYARLAQRLNSWLSTYTSSGVLYDTDLRLRPDGASGLLVSSAAAFAGYQANHAWLWEHQALSRARFCAGNREIGDEFEQIRCDILRQKRDPQSVRDDVLAMRKKMHEGHPIPAQLFDVKHSPGGLVDIEFIVQYLVLAHACDHEALTVNAGNIALLERAGALGLIPVEQANAAANSYRELRRLQHRAWLSSDAAAQLQIDIVTVYAQPVTLLWKSVFGSSA